jgi:aminoglycoside N3'-acetyltransferase
MITFVSGGAEAMEILERRPLAIGLGLTCVFGAVFGLGALVGSAVRLVVDEVAVEKDEPKEDRYDL